MSKFVALRWDQRQELSCASQTEAIPSFIQIATDKQGRFDDEASSIVLNFSNVQKRLTFAQLGGTECGHVPTIHIDKQTGWLAYGKPSRGAWNPVGVVTWGDHSDAIVDNGDGTVSIRYYNS